MRDDIRIEIAREVRRRVYHRLYVMCWGIWAGLGIAILCRDGWSDVAICMIVLSFVGVFSRLEKQFY